jgi:hypothetical protein
MHITQNIEDLSTKGMLILTETLGLRKPYFKRDIKYKYKTNNIVSAIEFNHTPNIIMHIILSQQP